MSYTNASVKVMRSYDYCHFEVAIGMSEVAADMHVESVNNMRIEAARLVDKAVEDYKQMKDALDRKGSEAWMKERIVRELNRVKDAPMEEWKPRYKAMKKKLDDEAYWQRRRDWHYGDDPWEDEYPEDNESDDGISF